MFNTIFEEWLHNDLRNYSHRRLCSSSCNCNWYDGLDSHQGISFSTLMEQQWKEQIEFAYTICCHATLPLRDHRDRQNAFRFVRAELEEKYVSDDSYKEQIHFIRETFKDELPLCCEESGTCSCDE
jgi:hypothetical protein